VSSADTAYNDVVDPKQARNALIQFALWGTALAVIGGSIAIATRPHTDQFGLYSGDETGFWFGVIVAWIGTLILLVPVIAWGAKLGRDAWPVPRERVGSPVAPHGVHAAP
jgi:hypothetical protein